MENEKTDGVTTPNSGENIGDTTAPSANDTGTLDVSKTDGSNPDNIKETSETVEPKKRTFTEEEVNKIMQKRVNRSHQSFFDRYNVKDLKELDEKFGLIDLLTTDKENLSKENETLTVEKNELLEKLAFIENDINPERVEDVKAYFKGKNIVLDGENLKTELATHPEWKKSEVVNNTPVTTIKEMSPTRSINQEGNEAEEVAKMFGLSKIYNFRR